MRALERLAVIQPFAPPPASGIANTFRDKVDAWTTLVSDTRVFVLRTPGQVIDERLTGDAFEHVEGTSLARAFADAARRVRAFGPDAIYARYSLPFRGYSRLVRYVPTVFEIHSAELVEYRRHRQHLLPYAAVGRWRVLHNAAGHVYVNESASTHWSNRIFRRPRITIPNGISLANVPRRPRKVTTAPLRIVMTVGSPNVWQGEDHFLSMASLFPQHRFFLITPEPTIHSAAPENLSRLAPMQRNELLEFLASCDLGVGTMALYRSGRNEVASLKVREYLSAGLAVLLPHTDTEDQVNDLEQVLNIPNAADSVESSISQITEFLDALRRDEIDFGVVDFLSTEAKERERLEFINRCVSEFHR